MKPISEIAKDLKLSRRTIVYRFDKLGIKGKKRILTHYFTQQEIDKISYKKHINPSDPILSNPDNYKEQVKIIEAYVRLGKRSCVEVAKITGIRYSTCTRVINYFIKRDCIIVKSRL